LYSDYKFSPRTSVYALYSYVQNNGQSNFGPIYGLSATTTTNGQDIQAVALGLKHTF
jgi:predicted porin